MMRSGARIMSSIALGVGVIRRAMRRMFNAHWRVCAGAAFVALALVAIEYDEVFAPEIGRLSDAWSNVAGDFGRRISSLAL
jgi:hypothetical protein